jgi:hypothetical protein
MITIVVVVSWVACCAAGYLVRAALGERREDRSYDDGWDDCVDAYNLRDLEMSLIVPSSPSLSAPSPAPSPKSPSSSSSPSAPTPPPAFTPSPPPALTPAPSPAPRWAWDDRSGLWEPREDLQSTFVRELLHAPLEAIPALFGAGS